MGLGMRSFVYGLLSIAMRWFEKLKRSWIGEYRNYRRDESHTGLKVAVKSFRDCLKN